MGTKNPSQTHTSTGGTNFQVVYNKNSNSFKHYGISATMREDPQDCSIIENLFFTDAEAEAYCRWLAENDVYPVTLCDVLANVYVL